MARILWLSSIGSDRSKDDIESLLEEVKRADTKVEVRTLDRGPAHLEYYYYEALVLPDTLHAVKRAEQEGFDAVVLGCFYDIGLDEARELTESTPVVAPAEATTHVASMLGDRFSILLGRRKWIVQVRDRLDKYGLDNRLSSFETVGCGVLDFQADPEGTHEKLLAAGRRAVDGGAEALVLGCASEYGFYEELQNELGVPVLDPVVVPFKLAELQAELASFGWSHSKIGSYESPPPAEVAEFGLPDDYRTGSVWGHEHGGRSPKQTDDD